MSESISKSVSQSSSQSVIELAVYLSIYAYIYLPQLIYLSLLSLPIYYRSFHLVIYRESENDEI